MGLRLHFLGVRGSTPVSGPGFAQVGGHTSCIAVSAGADAGAGVPALVLDAGTGLQTIGSTLGDRPFDGWVLLTHLHWDHVQGLPFAPALDRDDSRVVLGQPAQGDPTRVLGRAMSPPHFPITPAELRGDWTHVALEAGKHQLGPFEVLAVDVVHKGGRAFGYRVSFAGTSFAYVPDALDANEDALLELATDVAVLVRGAPFVASESERAVAYGHGTVEAAAAIATRARAGCLVLTHHAPNRTDADVFAIAERLGAIAATEGMTLDL
jgi:phosphoribosyl 1,2-cyclic phosphodiesterase